MFTGIKRIKNKSMLILFKVTKVSNRGASKTPKSKKNTLEERRRGKGCNVTNELIPNGISNQ